MPANKREMARRVYDRFANGDATEFFAQLFLLLDGYANYAKRIPQAVSETNQSTLALSKKVREEIGLLAQIVEKRSVEMGNAAEDTSTLCLETQEKAEAAAQRLEKLTQDMASKVDTESIVESIRTCQSNLIGPWNLQPSLVYGRHKCLSCLAVPTWLLGYATSSQIIKEINLKSFPSATGSNFGEESAGVDGYLPNSVFVSQLDGDRKTNRVKRSSIITKN